VLTPGCASSGTSTVRPVRQDVPKATGLFLQQLADALERLGWLPLALFGVRQILLDAPLDPSTVVFVAQSTPDWRR